MSLTITDRTGRSLTFDTVISATYDPPVLVTQNPIEDGASATDHIQRLPETFSVEALLSSIPDLAAAQRSAAQAFPPTGEARLLAVEDFLRQALSAPVIVTFRGRTGRRFLSSMPYPISNRQGIIFALSFTEVIIPVSSTQTLPRLRPSKPNLKKEDQGDGDKPKPPSKDGDTDRAKGKVGASFAEIVATEGVDGVKKRLGTVLGTTL